MNPDPANAPCISQMLEGAVYGSRHATALRISAWLRWRYPEHVVRLIMEDWRQRVTTEQKPFHKTEMDKITSRLSNSNFVDKAPKEIVDQEKTNFNNLEKDANKISFTLKSL